MQPFVHKRASRRPRLTNQNFTRPVTRRRPFYTPVKTLTKNKKPD
jgi:hypothetical protein